MTSTTSPKSALRQMSALTFLMFAMRGLTLPFISLYLASIGFTGTEIGIVIGVGALAQLVVTPLSHMLADRAGQHRRLFYAIQISHILSMIGEILPFGKVWVSASNVVRDSANVPGVSLLSQLTVTRLDELKRPIYGRIRAWGSFGWSVTTFISGGIIAIGGYPLLFVLAAVSNIAMLPFIRSLPERTTGKVKLEKVVGSRPLVFYLLLISVALFQIGMNVTSNFGYLYFKRDLGASDALIGVIASVAALSEIPTMFLYDRFLRRASIQTLMVVGMIGMAGLWFSLTALTDSSLILPVMLLRGPFFTLQSVSLVLLVSKISHPSNVATNQALAQVTAPGIAVLLTSPLNGWIFDHLGGRFLLQLVAILALLSVVLLVMLRSQLDTRRNQLQTLEPAPAAPD